MNIKYIGRTSYYDSAFLISMKSEKNSLEYLKKHDKKMIMWSIGKTAFTAEQLLNKYNINICCYTDNNLKICGNIYGGREIISPYDLFKEKDKYHFILALNNIRDINAVRIQLLANGIDDYSIIFQCPFHNFCDENIDLHNIIMQSINEMTDSKENEYEVIPYTAWQNIDMLGNINYLLYSTQWSHWAYLWVSEILKENNKLSECLEIGPGYGLLSLVMLKLHDDIHIDWCLFGDKDGDFYNSVKKIHNKYKNKINEIWGSLQTEISLNKKYDLIILTEVFEHFAYNPVNTMEKMADALKPDGKIILTTPDWGHVNIYKTWRDMITPEHCDEYSNIKLLEQVSLHVYQYSYSELEEIFDESGLKIIKYKTSDINNHNIILQIK